MQLTISLNNFVNMKKIIFATFAVLLTQLVSAQNPFNLESCVTYAVENNEKLKTDRLALQTAAESKREVLGALLPQVSAQGGLTYNIQKTTFAMPNFMNQGAMYDPNADKYLIITMGMDLSANLGAGLSQQIVNFSLFNALKIAEQGREMAKIGVDISTEDLVAQTVILYYGIQVLDYAIGQLDVSIGLMDRTLKMLEINQENGLMRPVDVGQVKVNKTNLETEKSALEQALKVQKNVMKLQMGFPMEEELTIMPINLEEVEAMVFSDECRRFDVTDQLPYRMFKARQSMLDLQLKSAKFETLPVVNLTANYAMNYMGDDFVGETFHKFPVSMVGLNLKMPIFTGMSKNAKIKKAKIEIQKSQWEEKSLTQALTMTYGNNLLQLDQTRKTILTQRGNKELAQEVFDVTEKNYNEGISSLSDLLNATSSLIQSQMNYVTALNNCMKAYIDLKKAEGTIRNLKF